MATESQRLGIKIFEQQDTVSMDTFNENWNAIDSKVAKLDELQAHARTIASETVAGHVQLSDSVSSNSVITAASSRAVKNAYDTAQSALTLAEQAAGRDIGVATTTETGVVKVGTNISVAADGTISIPNASTSTRGTVILSSSTSSTSTTNAATASAVKSAYDLATTANTLATTVDTNLKAHQQVAASTSQAGHVQLSSSVTSTSETTAATSAAVKSAYDLATQGNTKADATATALTTHQANTVNSINGQKGDVIITSTQYSDSMIERLYHDLYKTAVTNIWRTSTATNIQNNDVLNTFQGMIANAWTPVLSTDAQADTGRTTSLKREVPTELDYKLNYAQVGALTNDRDYISNSSGNIYSSRSYMDFPTNMALCCVFTAPVSSTVTYVETIPYAYGTTLTGGTLTADFYEVSGTNNEYKLLATGSVSYTQIHTGSYSSSGDWAYGVTMRFPTPIHLVQGKKYNVKISSSIQNLGMNMFSDSGSGSSNYQTITSSNTYSTNGRYSSATVNSYSAKMAIRFGAEESYGGNGVYYTKLYSLPFYPKKAIIYAIHSGLRPADFGLAIGSWSNVTSPTQASFTYADQMFKDSKLTRYDVNIQTNNNLFGLRVNLPAWTVVNEPAFLRSYGVIFV